MRARIEESSSSGCRWATPIWAATLKRLEKQ
jgi:hypothetical protein